MLYLIRNVRYDIKTYSKLYRVIFTNTQNKKYCKIFDTTSALFLLLFIHTTTVTVFSDIHDDKKISNMMN